MNLNMEDIRTKMRARHSVVFAPQKMLILAESNMQNAASMRAGETSVLMGDGMMDMGLSFSALEEHCLLISQEG